MENKAKMNEKARRRVRRGYERLAYGGIADAVRLLFTEQPDLTALDKMDLYNIAEISAQRGEEWKLNSLTVSKHSKAWRS